MSNVYNLDLALSQYYATQDETIKQDIAVDILTTLHTLGINLATLFYVSKENTVSQEINSIIED